MRTILFALILLAGLLDLGFSQNSESGPVGVYADSLHGRQTASGAAYDRNQFTAAHATLPFGSIVRVANFQSGRMVDVRVIDRKPRDGRILTISGAAAEAVQLPGKAVAPGSYLLMGQVAPTTQAPHAIPAPVAPLVAATPPAVVRQAGGAPSERKFKPLAGLFGKEQQPTPSYQYPSITAPAFAPSPQPGGELIHMNATSPAAASVPGPALKMPQPPVTVAPTPSIVPLQAVSPAAPYRVQFGAFRRTTNADELAGMLRGAGIPASVFAAPSSDMNLVVTDSGFRSAEEAQRWIDFEGARRGWKDRPVVIR